MLYFRKKFIFIINYAQEGPSLITYGKEQWIKKTRFNIQDHISKIDSGYLKKICLFLCSCKWLTAARHSLVIPLHFWKSKTLFEDDLINFNRFFLKAPRVGTLWIVGLLSYTILVEKTLKRWASWNRLILCLFLLWFTFLVGITWER